MTDRTPTTTVLDAAWKELVLDALASDGRISDADVKNAVARHRPRIEAEARASLLAELRAQAFGSPRCVPLSIIERIFAALEEPTP